MPSTKNPSQRQLRTELRRLQTRLAESEATMKAIRSGDVDAIVVEGPKGSRIFTLQSPEEPYRILAERMNEGAATLTAEGTILFCNQRLAGMVGIPAERLLGTFFVLTLQESERESFAELLRQASKKDMRSEGHLRCADGAVLPVQLSLNSIPLEGSEHGICLIASDLSDQKRAEAAKAAIVDSTEDGIIGKTLEGTITSWNRGAEKIYGYSAQEMIGQSVSILIPPDHLSDFEAIIAGIKRGGPVRHYETVRTRKGGERVHVSLTVSPIKDAAGKVVGASTIVRDISERKRTEAELQLSRERLALAQKAGHSGTFDWDIQNNINHWSAEVEEVYGIAPGEFGGRYEDWEALVVPEDLITAKKAIEQSIKTGEFASEWRIRRRNDGEIRWITAHAKVIFDGAGRPERMLGLNMDVTERKRAEEEVRRLNQELEQRVIERTAQLEAANKELEAFTYSVSHDLRAPLRHISGFSKILSEEFGANLPDDAQHHLQRIQDGTRRMGQLVDDLLNLARVGRRDLGLRISGLKSLVEEVIAELTPEYVNRQTEWRIGDLPLVQCDPGLMKQVFQNLLSNAVKFTRPRSQAVIEVGQKDENGTPVVFVRDNGVGFNMKYADKLFGVFQRLHRPEDFEGTGVGLATVQRIIQKHGGRIWAEAELDRGATFYFTLGVSGNDELKSKAAMAGEKL